MFRPVDIVESLDHVKEHDTVGEAKGILSEEFLVEQGILDRLSSDNSGGDYPDIEALDPGRLYTLEQIKAVCIRYRLRFLDTKYFKGDFPYEAISEIKKLEAETAHSFSELYLVAPSKRFILEDCEKDPLLLARVGQNSYYLIHKWGRDLSWFRSIVMYPLRSLGTLVISIIALSALVAIFTPDSILAIDKMALDIPYLRWAWFFKVLITMCGMAALILAAFHKSLSSSQWNDNLFTR